VLLQHTRRRARYRVGTQACASGGTWRRPCRRTFGEDPGGRVWSGAYWILETSLPHACVPHFEPSRVNDDLADEFVREALCLIKRMQNDHQKE
jgi:hypothetical protein